MQLDPWGAGVENKLFEYNDAYKALDHASRFDSKYGVTTRAGGVVQAVGGVGTMVVGAGLCETGVGCVAGVPVAAYGADHAYTGAKAIVTGKNHSTLGGQLLSQVTGLSPETANLVYDLPNLYAGAKPILGATAKLGKQVVAEGSEMASAAGYVAGELAKDAKAGALAIKNAADKAYIRAQYGYEDLVDAGVNGAREYVRNGVKSMGEQTIGSALKGVAATVGVKTGFEAYDYINGKPLTPDNLKNSGKNIFYSAGLAGATAGMPIIPATALGVVTDWHKDDGKYDVVKTTGGSVIGSVIDSKFGNKPYSPIIRESVVNGFERVYEQMQKGDK